MPDTPRATDQPLAAPDSDPGSGRDPGGEDITLRGFQKLIRDRYFATDNARGTAGTFLYLAEEFGELATALANNNRPSRPATPEERANLEEEFADVLAWLATLANINGVDLADTLVKYTDPGRVEGTKE